MLADVVIFSWIQIVETRESSAGRCFNSQLKIFLIGSKFILTTENKTKSKIWFTGGTTTKPRCQSRKDEPPAQCSQMCVTSLSFSVESSAIKHKTPTETDNKPTETKVSGRNKSSLHTKSFSGVWSCVISALIAPGAARTARRDVTGDWMFR